MTDDSLSTRPLPFNDDAGSVKVFSIAFFWAFFLGLWTHVFRYIPPLKITKSDVRLSSRFLPARWVLLPPWLRLPSSFS